VEAHDAADDRVDLLLSAESRQRECRSVHAEEFRSDGDEVARRFKKRFCGVQGRFEVSEPHEEDQGNHQRESAADAIVGTR
jgi:hypothetical protein